jgi:hypothetical protein
MCLCFFTFAEAFRLCKRKEKRRRKKIKIQYENEIAEKNMELAELKENNMELAGIKLLYISTIYFFILYYHKSKTYFLPLLLSYLFLILCKFNFNLYTF